MKISVIIPAWNEEEYITHCLESLLAQSEAPDEIIVVDNNSTDRTVSMAQAYGATVISSKIKGLIPTRNIGFDAASSEIIARTDADTILPQNWIKTIKKNFRDAGVAAISGPVVYDGPISNKNLNTLLFFKVNKVILGHETLLGPNMAIRKTVWQKVRHETCFDDHKHHEDMDLAIHMAPYGKIVFDPKLMVQTSARRLKKPSSFFIEYPHKWIKTLHGHKKIEALLTNEVLRDRAMRMIPQKTIRRSKKRIRNTTKQIASFITNY